jgi:membrane protein DedA with SNARE-associated domain
MDLSQLLDLIRQHGEAVYGFVFAYAAGNGMVMPLLAGYIAHQGILDWKILVAVCWAGSFLGDIVRFWVGRRFGPAVIENFPRAARVFATVIRLVDRHYVWMILVYRYPYGIRGIAAFAFGMSRLQWLPFLVLSFISAFVWALATVLVGYSFGHVSEKVLGEAASTVGFAILAVFILLGWVLSKKLDRVVEREGRGP